MSLSPEQRPVVVGVDGSESGRHALLWATREAAARRVPLRIVYGETWKRFSFPPHGVEDVPGAGRLHVEGDVIVERAAAEARGLAPDVPVEAHVVAGTAEAVLGEESRYADIVVVGSRGHGGFAGLLLGSVSRYLAARAECPVVVVRGNEIPNGPVVVGVDASAADDDTGLARAFEQAQRRRVQVVAVHAWEPPVTPRVQRSDWDDFVSAAEREAHIVIDSAVRPWQGKYPSVPVERQVRPEAPGTALVAACQGAQLLVVGSRAPGPLRGMALGSVAQVVLSHAPCPVLVHRGTMR